MSPDHITYIPPKTPMEFVKPEMERGLSNGSISHEQAIPPPISFSPSFDPKLIKINLSYMAEILSKSSDRDPSLLSGRIDEQPTNEQPYGRMFSPEPFYLFAELMRRNTDSFSLDFSPISSSKKLNGDEIAETLQSEASFTIATDKKPIVATYSCGPCVALGGYDATNKIAFIVHFSLAEEVIKSGELIFDTISKLAKIKIESPIQLHLRGGIKGESEATIEAIKMWMKQREDLPMEIATEDILDCGMCIGGKSLSVDSRNGEVTEYDPLTNPRSRGMSDLDAKSAMMSAFEPNIKLAYSPK